MPPKNQFEDPRFLAGAELGRSLGRLDAYNEVKQAYEDGTLETWLEHERPKAHEEWATIETSSTAEYPACATLFT